MSSRSYSLELSPQSKQDIVGILRYTGETWGKQQLLVYRDKLNEALNAIGQYPNLGQHCTELPETHRLHFVGSHVVVYRTRDNMVSIVRVLHQRMSILQHL